MIQKKSPSRSSQQGMTLIELLVAMACLVLVLAGVYHVFFTQSLSSTAEINILEAQINARAGMDRIAHVLRHAGFGCRDAFVAGKTMGGVEPDGNGSITVDQWLWDVVDNNATNPTTLNSDELVVVHGFRRVAQVTSSIAPENATDTVDYNNAGDPPVTTSITDFDNYICFFPHMEGDIFYRVTGKSGTELGSYTVDEDVRVLSTPASVFMVSPSRIQLDGDILEIKNFTYTTDQDWEVASGFEDLQFEYTEDGASWSGAPANPNKVIAVRAWLLARSERGDPGYTDTRTYTYAGQTVGPFNDNVHRWLIEETVWIRNKVAD